LRLAGRTRTSDRAVMIEVTDLFTTALLGARERQAIVFARSSRLGTLGNWRFRVCLTKETRSPKGPSPRRTGLARPIPRHDQSQTRWSEVSETFTTSDLQTHRGNSRDSTASGTRERMPSTAFVQSEVSRLITTRNRFRDYASQTGNKLSGNKKPSGAAAREGPNKRIFDLALQPIAPKRARAISQHVGMLLAEVILNRAGHRRSHLSISDIAGRRRLYACSPSKSTVSEDRVAIFSATCMHKKSVTVHIRHRRW
jgi:hypothetical protein